MSDFTKYAVVDVADNTTTVVNGPARLYGVYVNTALSAHTLPIANRDFSASPNVETTVVTIPASAAAGAMYTFPGIEFANALVVNPNDAATGNITVVYKRGIGTTAGVGQA